MAEVPRPAYIHSGRLGAALVVVPIVVLVATPTLALVYSYLIVYVPIAGYVSLLFVLGFGVCLALVVASSGYVAKCRNAPVLCLMGLLTGLFGLYCSWVAFEYALLRRADPEFDVGLLEMAQSPGAIWAVAKDINETGWYEVFGATPKGVLLWLFWAVEALLIVGMPTACAPMWTAPAVFCEPCGCWCDQLGDPLRLAIPSDAAVVGSLQSGRLDVLDELPNVTAAEPAYLRVEVQQCPECETTAAYQLTLVKRTRDSEGKFQEQTQDLTEWLVLEPGEVAQLEALATREARLPADWTSGPEPPAGQQTPAT